MTLSDEMLGAYIDGELDPSSRSKVEAAIVRDPEIQKRIERMRAVQNQLLAAFSGATQEPVPDRLTTTLHSKPTASVTPLRPTARLTPRWTWPEFTALAASVVVGVGLGYFLLRSPSNPLESGQLLTQGDIADALSTQLASSQSRDAPIRIGLTFQDKAGAYCRSFVVRDTRSQAALACREPAGWRIEALAAVQGSQTDAEPAAGTLPPTVLQAIESRIAGDALDARGEAQARTNNWRKN